MIMDGELDHIPEAAFNLKGTIEEAIEAGEKMIAEAKQIFMFIEIVSPEKTIYTGDVNSVYLPGTDGFFQILNNHAPIVSTLKKGTIKLSGKFEDDVSENLNLEGVNKASLAIESGVVEMKNNKLIILVD